MAAKKFLLSLLLTILLSTSFVICSPQDTSSPSWPLEVVGLQMTIGDGRSVSNTTSATSIGGNMRASGGLGGPVPGGQQKISFYLKTKNPSSDKTIKQIEWECCFLNIKNETVKNSFKSKKKLKPSAKEETIEETIFFNVATIPTKVKLGFRIKKIEYEDNSVWESKSTTPDADFVFQNVDVN
ncbi:MAG: hypothetical protein HY819_03295 [Acidobacteria bacterium]|nr:hypothetical protein [Acidobacteriota bacterium]